MSLDLLPINHTATSLCEQTESALDSFGFFSTLGLTLGAGYGLPRLLYSTPDHYTRYLGNLLRLRNSFIGLGPLKLPPVFVGCVFLEEIGYRFLPFFLLNNTTLDKTDSTLMPVANVVQSVIFGLSHLFALGKPDWRYATLTAVAGLLIGNFYLNEIKAGKGNDEALCQTTILHLIVNLVSFVLIPRLCHSQTLPFRSAHRRV